MLKRLRIFGKNFPVEIIPSTEFSGTVIGRVNCNLCKIYISEDLADDQKCETLLHEVLHALDNAMYLEMSERQINALAAGLLAVLRDNPKFGKWLSKGK